MSNTTLPTGIVQSALLSKYVPGPPASVLSWLRYVYLFLITCLGFSILGYHPGVEDDFVYLAIIKHDLNPALFPHDLPFVTLQSQFTLFDRLIALSAHALPLPLGDVILLWQFAGLYLLLIALWHIAAFCFVEASARWAAVSFVAVMLAMPASASDLFLVDQHLHPRLLATDCILFAIIAILHQRRVLAAILLVAGAVLHPLMTAFGVSYCAFLVLEQRQLSWWRLGAGPSWAAALPGSWLWERPTPEWHMAAGPRKLLYLYKWPWYGWLGIVGPMCVAGWVRQIALRRRESGLVLLCSSILSYSIFQLAVALVLLCPFAPAWFLQLEPMRFLHLLYLLTALLAAGAFGRVWLKRHALRWALVFVPLVSCMYIDQQMEFAGSPHIEWPGAQPTNPWLQAFSWVRQHTPTDAYFALDPLYDEEPLEGVHSFRALAERSMLADAVKDPGVVTHVPHLAPRWIRETDARVGWKQFGSSDFAALHRQFGVNWVLLDKPVAGLTCPYRNWMISVCQVPLQ